MQGGLSAATRFEPKCFRVGLDWVELKAARVDWIWLETIRVDLIGLDQIGFDWIGLVRCGMECR